MGPGPMQKKVRRRSWILAGACAGVVLAVAVGARLWPTETTSGPVPVAARVAAEGPLRIGAATVPLSLHAPLPLAGFGLFRAEAARVDALPLGASALSFGPFAIVSVDLLEMPHAIQAAISARLPGRIVWLCATHTHSGPGGYDPSPLAQLAGARRFDSQIFEAVVDAAVSAVAQAERAAVPATLRLAKASHPELKRGRTSGATPDPALWLLQARALDDQPLALLLAFGAHPTFVSRRAATLSPDWPGATAQALVAQGAGAVALVVQGAGGDSSVAGPATASAYAQALTQAIARSPAAPSAGGAVSAEIRPATVTFAPLLGLGTRLTTAVGVARVGEAALVCLPGELTGAALADLEARAPWLRDALVLTLCGDELAYVESPRLQASGGGERLVLFPRAVEELGGALQQPP